MPAPSPLPIQIAHHKGQKVTKNHKSPKDRPPHSPRKNLGRRGWWRGYWAEHLAALYLRLYGYKILARRYAHPLGEIDVIAVRRGVLAMVEVKARPDFDSALGAVTRRQQLRISRAAQVFLTQNRRYIHHTIRFDLIVIRPGVGPCISRIFGALSDHFDAGGSVTHSLYLPFFARGGKTYL